MEMANLGAGMDTKTVIASSLSKSQTSKETTGENSVKTGFSKFLDEKFSKITVKEFSVEDCINQLKTIIANLKVNISKEDNQVKLIVKDSKDKNYTDKSTITDETNALISLLSSLLNNLTPKSEPILNLISQLNTKLSEQSQPLKETINESKLVAQAKIPIVLANTLPFVKETINETKLVAQANLPITSDNTLPFAKQIKEINNVIDKLLSSVKSEGTNTVLKGNDITKLEGILKNLTQVVDTAEKQVTIKNTTVDMQTLVKSQLLLSGSSNNDTSKQNKDSGYSKSNTDVDKILQKIANQDGSDKTQSFSNLVNRVSNQNDIATTKVADSLLISKDSLINDVIKTVKFMNVNDIKDLTVKIAPKDLGEVVIKLTQEGNVMKATITTSNKEAYQLINSNLQEINDKISSNNTSIQSFSVDVFNGERSFFKQGSQQNNESGKGKNSKVDSIEEDDGIETISNNDSNLNILV